MYIHSCLHGNYLVTIATIGIILAGAIMMSVS